MKKFLLVVLVVGAGLGFCGYSIYTSFQRCRAASDVAIAEFHREFNAGAIAKIYSSADERFRKASPEKDFAELLAAVKRKLGAVKTTASGPLNVRTMNTETTMVATQLTTFEQGTATETFSFEYSGDRPLLLGYNISSIDLVVK